MEHKTDPQPSVLVVDKSRSKSRRKTWYGVFPRETCKNKRTKRGSWQNNGHYDSRNRTVTPRSSSYPTTETRLTQCQSMDVVKESKDPTLEESRGGRGGSQHPQRHIRTGRGSSVQHTHTKRTRERCDVTQKSSQDSCCHARREEECPIQKTKGPPLSPLPRSTSRNGEEISMTKRGGIDLVSPVKNGVGGHSWTHYQYRI